MNKNEIYFRNDNLCPFGFYDNYGAVPISKIADKQLEVIISGHQVNSSYSVKHNGWISPDESCITIKSMVFEVNKHKYIGGFEQYLYYCKMVTMV